MSVLVNGTEIQLSGTVGDLWFDEGFTSAEVIAALAQVGDEKDVTIRLNSGGGIATEGSAIHAAITRHTGKVVVVVDGIAASAASLIAIAGDELEMSLGSVLMIHDPSGVTVGTAADHEITTRALNAMGDAFAGIYAAKTGQTIEACRADMKAEVWLTPEQAVAKGYADRVGAAPANDNAEEPPVTAFDYRIYAHAPKKLVALAKKNGWRMSADRTEAAPAAPHRPKENPMANEKTGATTPEEIEAARLNAAEDAATTATANAAEIVDICAAAGVPAMASALIREGVTVEQAKARATSAKDITAAVDTAKKAYPQITLSADEFIAQGKTLQQVQAALFEKITAAQSPEISQFHQPAGKSGANASTASMERELKRAGLAKGA